MIGKCQKIRYAFIFDLFTILIGGCQISLAHKIAVGRGKIKMYLQQCKGKKWQSFALCGHRNQRSHTTRVDHTLSQTWAACLTKARLWLCGIEPRTPVLPALHGSHWLCGLEPPTPVLPALHGSHWLCGLEPPTPVLSARHGPDWCADSNLQPLYYQLCTVPRVQLCLHLSVVISYVK